MAYAKEREQFNRPIASFQAVKHMCAEMAAHLEPCRAMVWFAAHALNELPDEALIRELKEELAIETWKSCLAPVTFVLHKYKDFHAILFLFICRRWDGIPNPLEGQEMTWVRRTELKQYQMPEANSFLVAILRDWI